MPSCANNTPVLRNKRGLGQAAVQNYDVRHALRPGTVRRLLQPSYISTLQVAHSGTWGGLLRREVPHLTGTFLFYFFSPSFSGDLSFLELTNIFVGFPVLAFFEKEAKKSRLPRETGHRITWR